MKPPTVVLDHPPDADEAELRRQLGITWTVRPREPVVPPRGPRRYKRRRDARLDERQVRAAWKLYEAGWSLRRLGREIWDRHGFASSKSAAVALHQAFRLEGFELRDRIEATRTASTIHGLSGRNRRRDYRRRVKKLRGEYQPTCAGIKRNPPGRGERCSRPAIVGSDYCRAHDPALEQRRVEHMAAMRERRAA